jgi:hypothetical protein
LEGEGGIEKGGMEEVDIFVNDEKWKDLVCGSAFEKERSM